jgi:putative DNA primase/helicase
MVQDMLAYREPPLPVLRRITKTPVFTPDGKLHTTPGYHESACIYYAPTDGFNMPEVSESPTFDEVKKAKECVDDIICDFPFVSSADRAHAVALLLLPFVRDLIDGPTPIHLIESPSPGSGKSLLADALLRPAVGNSISVLTHTSDDDEMRKRITSLLREGRSVVMLDNLTRMLDSGVLAGAITGDRWSDRILGVSAMLNLPVRCVWIVTGNNPSMSMEIARRAVRVRLDAGIEKGWLREGFRHENLRAWVKEHRGAIIWAALTLISHWIASGKPEPQDRFIGSFESWSGVMGGILKAAGYDGFLENLDEFYEAADAEADGLRAFVKAWWEQFGSDTVTAAQLFSLAAEIGLCDADGGAERAQKISFGKQLTRLRDRIFDGYRIVSAGHFRRAAQWKLLPLHPSV